MKRPEKKETNTRIVGEVMYEQGYNPAWADGAEKDDVILLDVAQLEGDKTLMGVLRFLLKDNAFDTDFLLTTILEYISNNSKE